MRNILFIKTSSLGDVLHHMPAVADARRHDPQARIDWVVEELYVPLARLCRAADLIIPVATRRWRHELLRASAWREARGFVRAIRARRYDAIIDTQGLVRTAVISRVATGRRHGYDAGSIREPWASRLYDVRHVVSWTEHVIARNRKLTGLALGYEVEGEPDFAIDRAAFASAGARNYAVMLHATANARKEWTEEGWTRIGRALASQGLDVVIPWGTAEERARSERLAAAIPRAMVPERRPILDVAKMLAGARIVAGVDTGFLHIAAALGTPVVAVFTLAKSVHARPAGPASVVLVGGRDAMPDAAEVEAAVLGSFRH